MQKKESANKYMYSSNGGVSHFKDMHPLFLFSFGSSD